MNKFAKLFETSKGQVLVLLKRDGDEANPTLIISCQPENLGVCEMKNEYQDTDEGWDAAEKAFSEMTEEWALGLCQPMFEGAELLGGAEQ